MNAKKMLALGAFMGCSSMAFAAVGDTTQLDIVIRDFQPNHPDFENFSEESVRHQNDIFGYTAGAMAMRDNGYGLDWTGSAAYHVTCGNKESMRGARIGQDGKPMALNAFLPSYLQSTSTSGAVLQYGECANSTQNGITQRGYAKVSVVAGDTTVRGFVCAGGNTVWANDVYYTPGMVVPYLAFNPKPGQEIDMLDDVTIVKAQDLCDNANFGQWYADVPGTNLRTNTTMDLLKVKGTNYYEFDYNYNNGGYSPLDEIDPVTGAWVGPKACNAQIQPNGVCEQFGPQSLSIFCPPYNYEYAGTQTDYRKQNTAALCKAWLQYGGPRNVASIGGISAAANAAAAIGTLGMQHLRNYAFTMMGYAKFKYRKANQLKKHEVFEFAGDDDMWIFVDGVLAVDLGGTHLAAPGSVDIEVLAQNNHGCRTDAAWGKPPLADGENCVGASDATGWADNTWHHLHFFYADRQTDGSNIYIRSSLAEVAPSRYGQPSVSNVTVKADENGNQVTSILLNTALSNETIASINAAAAAASLEGVNNGEPTMVVVRTVVNADGTKSYETYGYYVTTITGGVDKESSGILYQMTGVLKDKNGKIVEGGILNNDQMAFNSMTPTEPVDNSELQQAYDALAPGLWDQLTAWNALLSFNVASGSGKAVVGYPDNLTDWAKVKFFGSNEIKTLPMDTVVTRPDFGGVAAELTNIADENGGELPENYTADLIITPLPENKDGKPVGMNGNPLSLTDDEAKYYGAAGEGGALAGTNSTAIVGGKATTAASKCFTENGVESCASWAFPMQGAFRINVRVFDHLGHFVSQYHQKVTKEDIAAALKVQQANSTKPNACSEAIDPADQYLNGETGVFLATVKMYPVSQDGRAVGTGVYIYQVTVIQEEGTPCQKLYGKEQQGNVMYTRTYNVYKRGYRRQN
ncbi:MAG: fibro-slime domain-containing protein [Fibrobacter sp.]|nr:fibro-slime domain-containing protein [Fibrobacter sp.]